MAGRGRVPTVRPMTDSRTALITGASRGLGRALALDLAADGWRLVVDGRDAEALRAAAAELGARTRVRAIPGDVADPTHRAALVEILAGWGGADAVVHNASLLSDDADRGRLQGLAHYPVDGLRRVLEANAIAPLALTQSVLPELRSDARVVAVTSDAAIEAYPGWGGYGASKAALEQLFAVLAVEHPGLRVYRVDPGEMRTRMYQDAAPEEDLSGLPTPEISVPGIKVLLTGDLPSGRYLARSLVPAEVR
jgi:NAD(P)-dependent dehydrogenase (short-subunit alcohol dehydrogenase family)